MADTRDEVSGGKHFTGEDFLAFYRKLDEVAPVSFDCGIFCGASCCNSNFEGGEDLGIYLLPGEEGINPRLKEADVYIQYTGNPESNYSVTFVKCNGPSDCIREIRPIQCRTYPLVPHLKKDGELILIYSDADLPYSCPLVEQNARINIEFYTDTLNVWKELIRDPRIYAFIELLSSMRDEGSVRTVNIIDG